jgi:hypothetical protein
MAKTAHARLDDETHHLLVKLIRATGENESALIRRGLERLAEDLPRSKRPRIIGIGAFESRVSDRGSNKKHLRGFGRS